MKQLQRALAYSLVGLCIFALPLFARAEDLSNGNFALDNINFSQVYTLETTAGIVPPNITNNGPVVTDIEFNQATIQWQTDKPATSTIKYGLTTAYDKETGLSQFTKDHSVTIFGLTPETTYHFQAISTDSAGGKGISNDESFTTSAETGIKSILISDIGYDQATITFETSNFSQYTLQYGPTTAYGQTITSPSSASTTKHIEKLTGLKSGTEYHLLIQVKNDKGGSATSSDFTFKTLPLPDFTTLRAVPVDANTMNIKIVTNTPTSKVLYYTGKNDQKGKEQVVASSDLSLDTTLTIGSLNGDSDYTYRVVITDQGGKVNEKKNQIFHTPKDLVPATITDLQVTTTRTADEISIIASWKTNKPTNDKVTVVKKGSEDNKLQLPGSTDYTLEHTIVGSGLKPATLYTLTATSVDVAGNVATKDITFLTPKASQSIFTLLAANFANSFDWLINLTKKVGGG